MFLEKDAYLLDKRSVSFLKGRNIIYANNASLAQNSVKDDLLNVPV
jgi:hypothetical protein